MENPNDGSTLIKDEQKYELTKAQTDQQDAIDNLLGDIVRTFLPQFTHDLMMTGDIRDVLVTMLSEKFRVPEMDIYPYFKIEE
jgi:hypothetical protein